MIGKKNRGSLSVDFLISITLSCLLLLFVILTALTFSLAEVAQYVAYASAREYFIGHNNYVDHEIQAEGKYDVLRSTFFPDGKALSKWFCLQPPGDLTIYNNSQTAGLNSSRTSFGVGFKFISHVMTMDIPFFRADRK